MHVVEYEHVKFEMPNPLNSSVYVGTSDATENAWMDIAYRTFNSTILRNTFLICSIVPDQMVSMEDFPKLQKPADSLKVTDPKTGETGYRVGLEVFHQLHCLNLLRMSTYPDYYPKIWWSDTNDKPEKVRAHLGKSPFFARYSPKPCLLTCLVDHCIEILRMNLMCLSDVNVFTFHDVPGRKGPWPDYESHHVCRNFEKIKQWANDNAMPYEDV